MTAPPCLSPHLSPVLSCYGVSMTVKSIPGRMHSVFSPEVCVQWAQQNHRIRNAAGTNTLTLPDIPGIRREVS